MSTPPHGYESVRQALLERGYLETPLERLFLGGVGDPLGRTVRGRIISALLAGLLGGLLLGVLLAAVLVLEGRGLVPLWPDGVLYAVLFAPVLGALVALAEAAAGLIIRVLARVRPGISPREASLVAGGTVSVLLSIYLGYWWVKSGGVLGARDLFALGVLALGAGFAGRVVSAAALVQASLAVGRAPQRPRPRTAALVGAIAIAVTLVAAAGATLFANGGPGAAAPVASAKPAGRSVLVAWDGLGWELARGLIAQDGPGSWLAQATPHGVRVVPSEPWDPVSGWTTVATGCPAALHGVSGAAMRGLRGAAAPLPQGGVAAGPLHWLTRLWPTEGRVVRAGVRRVPALWEVTATANKTAVIGWWGTWPASSPGPAGGYVVSDAALVALRRSRGLEQAIFPASWGASRAAGWLKTAELGAGTHDGELAPLVTEALVIDLFALAALDDALADPDVRVATVYLPGLDVLRERLRGQDRDPFETLAAVAAHARAIEAALAAVLGRHDATSTWIVGAPGRAGAGETGFVAGAGDRASSLGTGLWARGTSAVAVTSIAPNWLAANGYAVDDRMTGPLLPALATARRVRTTAMPAAATEPSQELEADRLEQLRSLGYVK